MATFNTPDFYEYESKSSQQNKKLVADRQKTFAYYNLVVLTSAILPILCVSWFNWAIDPYGVFNNKQYFKLNQAKPEQLKNTIFFKAIDVTRIKPTTIFFSQYKLSAKSLENLQKIVDLCKKHNIALRIFISPVLTGVTQGSVEKNL